MSLQYEVRKLIAGGNIHEALQILSKNPGVKEKDRMKFLANIAESYSRNLDMKNTHHVLQIIRKKQWEQNSENKQQPTQILSIEPSSSSSYVKYWDSIFG